MNFIDQRPHTKPWAGDTGGGDTDKNTVSQHVMHSLRIIINAIFGSHSFESTEIPYSFIKSLPLKVDHNCPRFPKSGFMLPV